VSHNWGLITAVKVNVGGSGYSTYAIYSSHQSETALNLSEELSVPVTPHSMEKNLHNSPELHDEGSWYRTVPLSKTRPVREREKRDVLHDCFASLAVPPIKPCSTRMCWSGSYYATSSLYGSFRHGHAVTGYDDFAAVC